MKNITIESSVVGMEDVGIILWMMDSAFAEGPLKEPEKMERAIYILGQVYTNRMRALRKACYGGGSDD